jgi:hypothetical protein
LFFPSLNYTRRQSSIAESVFIRVNYYASHQSSQIQ